MHILHAIALILLLPSCLIANDAIRNNQGTNKNSIDDYFVLADVGTNKITVKDFKRELNNLPDNLKAMADTLEGKNEILDTMVIREMVLQEASKSGIDKHPEIAEKMIALKKRLIVESYLKSIVGDGSDIPENKLKDFYERNQSRFKGPEEIRTSHILVKNEKRAEAILAQIKAGDNFEELARKYSTDSSASKGGDLGWFAKGSMVPTYDEAAFALKLNEISDIVKTDFGYHIIRLTGKRPAGIRLYDEVRQQIIAAILPTMQQEVFKNLKLTLKNMIKYKIYDGNFSKIH
jgi:peptidyl-prolyl cis-trans isomerase C